MQLKISSAKRRGRSEELISPLHWNTLQYYPLRSDYSTEVIFRANKSSIFGRRTEIDFPANNLIYWFAARNSPSVQINCF